MAGKKTRSGEEKRARKRNTEVLHEVWCGATKRTGMFVGSMDRPKGFAKKESTIRHETAKEGKAQSRESNKVTKNDDEGRDERRQTKNTGRHT